MSRSLKVVTWNSAHGRGTAVHQILLKKKKIQSNLKRFAQIIHELDVDIAAVQELDVFSFWNGAFSHLEFLQKHAPNLRYGFVGEHMVLPKLRYGTGLLAKYLLDDRLSHRFADSSPMPRKGFVAARMHWPGDRKFEFDIASLHLDFLRKGQRTRQANAMIQSLRRRSRPLILMGDFNSAWVEKKSAVAYLAAELQLTTYKPERVSTKLATFYNLGTRWDWILVSPEFKIQNYHNLTAKLSDHLAVVATVERN